MKNTCQKVQTEESEGILSNYAKSLLESKSGNKAAIEQKDNDKVLLNESMQKFTISVNYFAMGDTVILAEVGIPLVKQKGKPSPGKMLKPQGLIITNQPTSGSVKAEVMEAVGANSCNFEYTGPTPPTDATVWKTKGSTSKSCIISGLTPKDMMFFRVVGVGTRNQEIASDVVSCIVT